MGSTRAGGYLLDFCHSGCLGGELANVFTGMIGPYIQCLLTTMFLLGIAQGPYGEVVSCLLETM